MLTDCAGKTAAPVHPLRLSDSLIWAQRRLAAAGADAPRLTALVLLEHATGLTRETALAHPERELQPDQAAAFAELVARRHAREPLAYILGEREFFGRTF